MAVTKDQLIIEITANSAKATQGIEQMSGSLSRLERQIKDSSTAQEASARSLSGVGAAFAKVAGAVYVAKEAFALVQKVYAATVGEFQASQDGIKKLSNNLAMVGEKNVPAVVKAYKELADQIEETTTIEGDHIIKLAAMSVAMGRTDAQTKDLIRGAVGLAAVTDGDVDTAFQNLLQTYNGIGRSLKTASTEIASMTEAQLRSGEAVKFASREMFKYGEALLQTYDGQMKQAKNRVGEIMKEIGHIFVAGFNVDAGAFGFNKLVGEVLASLKSIGSSVAGTVAFVRALFDDLFNGLSAGIYAIIGELMGVVNVLGVLQPLISLSGSQFSVTKWVEETQASIKKLSVNIIKDLKNPWEEAQKAVDKYGKEVTASMDRAAKDRRAAEMTVSDTVKAKLEELAKLRRDFEMQLKHANDSEIDQIWAKGEAEIANLDAIRQKLELEKAYGDVAKANYAAAKKAILERNKLEEDKKRFEIFGAAAKSSEDANIALAQYRNIQSDIIEMRRVATQREIDDQIRILKINEQQNKLAIMSLQSKKGAVDATAKEEQRRAGGTQYQTLMKAGEDMAVSMNEALTNGVMGEVMGALGAASSVVGMAQTAVDAAQAAVDAVPKLLNSIGTLIDSITALPLKIAEGFSKILNSVLNLLKSLIPNLLKAVTNILQSVVSFVVRLPKMFASMVDQTATLLTNLVDKLPDMVEQLVEALIAMTPRLIAKTIEFFITKWPEITRKMAEAVVIEIPNAIIKGLVEGLKEFGRVWQRWMRGQFADTPMEIDLNADKIKKQVAQLTEDTSKLFAVEALAQGVKNAEDITKQLMDNASRAGKTMLQYFIQGLKDGWKWLKEAGLKIWVGLNEAADKIGDWGTKIWTSISDGAAKVNEWGTKIWNGITDAIGDVATTFGSWGTNIWNGLVGAIGDVTKTLGDWGTKIWNGFTGAIGDAFNGFGKSISDGFTAALPSISTAISGLFDGLKKSFDSLLKIDGSGAKAAITEAFNTATTGMQEAFKQVFNPLIDLMNGVIDALNAVKISELSVPVPKWAGGGTWKLWGDTDIIPGDIAKIQKFATGGLVGGTGTGDSVPAMLTPGEFVVNRGAVATIGLSNLVAMNGGKTPSGMTTQNIAITLNIESKERVDENFIRQRIMPTLREELKRGSLDGRAVVYSGGVRK